MKGTAIVSAPFFMLLRICLNRKNFFKQLKVKAEETNPEFANRSLSILDVLLEVLR